MKIFHCSDIHLGKRPSGGRSLFSQKRYEDYFIAFDYLVNFAINEEVDVFIIAGDFFDKKELSPDILERTESILKKLKEKEIAVIVTEGNHDNINKEGLENSWINYLENKNFLKRPSYNVRLNENGEKEFEFEKIKIGDVNFYALGYPGFIVNDVMTHLAEFLEKEEDKNNFVIVHTAISENDFLPGTVLKETINKFKDNVIYIAGGHFHSYTIYPKENPFFYIPGSSEFWNIQNEIGQKKGFIIFDTEKKEHNFYKSKTRNRLLKEIEIESNSFDEFKDEFQEKLKEIEIEKDEDILILNIKLKNNIYVNIEYCEELILEKGALKAYIKLIRKSEKDYEEDKGFLNINETEKEIIKTWDIFSKDSDYTSEMLRKFKEEQEDNEFDLFEENFSNFIEQFLK